MAMPADRVGVPRPRQIDNLDGERGLVRDLERRPSIPGPLSFAPEDIAREGRAFDTTPRGDDHRIAPARRQEHARAHRASSGAGAQTAARSLRSLWPRCERPTPDCPSAARLPPTTRGSAPYVLKPRAMMRHGRAG